MYDAIDLIQCRRPIGIRTNIVYFYDPTLSARERVGVSGWLMFQLPHRAANGKTARYQFPAECTADETICLADQNTQIHRPLKRT
jgi:hypothetical protein